MDGEKTGKKGPIISIIAAVGNNRAIGKDNNLLWKLPQDLKRFKKITLNHPIIMGRKTYESIGRPLAKRINIILSRNPELKVDGCLVMDSLEKALKYAESIDQDEVFIVGGESIFTEALPQVKKLYLTLVDDAPKADTFFPEYDDCFKIIHEKKGAENNYQYRFIELIRNK
jgi:dihydrofolate reductase